MMRSPLARKLAAVGLLLLVIGVLWTLLFDPLLQSIASDGERIAESRKLLARYEVLAAEAPLLEQKLQAAQSGAAAAALLDGASAILASAKLQSDLQQQATTAGVALRSSQTLPTKEESGFSRIGMQLDLGATAESLTRLLYGIENARPALFVDHLTVQASEGARAGNDPGPTPLTVRLQIYGYMRGTPS